MSVTQHVHLASMASSRPSDGARRILYFVIVRFHIQAFLLLPHVVIVDPAMMVQPGWLFEVSSHKYLIWTVAIAKWRTSSVREKCFTFILALPQHTFDCLHSSLRHPI